MKKILGLDLGTTSIGWALVNEAENSEEQSSIIRLGVRVVPLTVDEQGNFEKGKSITTNADRNLKHSMRLNLHRYKLRRQNLIECLKDNGIITDESVLCEYGNATTFETYRLRAKCATERVELNEFARVLLMINKKRGYKSSRKTVSADEGQAIDCMDIAKTLYNNKLTPGQYVYQNLSAGKNYVPDFYRSDLYAELESVWLYQQTFHPDILTDEFRKDLEGKSKTITTKMFLGRYGIYTAENKEKNRRLQSYKWRTEALARPLTKEELAYVIADINGAINNSSGYLGAIGDRSKELYFNQQTIGQYLLHSIETNPNCSLKNQPFYRNDYLDEFEIIWECQARFHPQLTADLKKQIRDIIIFYQRPLKSKKAMLDICEFENRQVAYTVDGKEKTKVVGLRVCPKASYLFQEFKIWQILNNLIVSSTDGSMRRPLNQDEKERLFKELTFKEKLSKTDVLKMLFKRPKGFELNYKDVEGNRSMAAIARACMNIVVFSGHMETEYNKLSADEILYIIESVFKALGYSTDFLNFDASLDGKDFYTQPAYRLWHLLYSYEGDNSKTGDEHLITKITELTGIDTEYARVLANVTFQNDYGNLSAKAIRRILPFMKEGQEYSEACMSAGYRHSKASLTREEIDSKVLLDHLPLIPRNSLRNPVVEKILNQMVNVVNAVTDTYGKPDEIRIELARELKKNAQERSQLSSNIAAATRETEKYKQILETEFGIPHVSRNDILRYRLYLELEKNGFKTLYTGTYIPREKLFSKEFDIEHIIPQARLFDDSFSNKTLETRAANIEKGKTTAYDYVTSKNKEEGAANYKALVDSLLAEGAISKTKHDKLLMHEADVPEGFIERDLRNSQYIARKSLEILSQLVRTVTPTIGAITDRLRDDWQLVDIMQELNWDKYNALGLTETYLDKDNNTVRKITNWTKRNDHRHHAMDALTIAFTTPSIIQYLNNLNARNDHSSSIYGIEKQCLYRDSKNHLRFNPPMKLDEFRAEAKNHLESVLISIKSKTKVVTRNVNTTKSKEGNHKKVQLTPRGSLHNETVYGCSQRYVTHDVKVDAKLSADVIMTVAKKEYREALMQRLSEFGGDAKKAFTGKNALDKSPIYVNELHTKTVPKKVKVVEFETIYPIRKAIDKDLKIDKVLDAGIRRILQARLDEFGGSADKAFSNLDENPIWLNKEAGISIKRVAVTGIATATSIHHKKDQFGNDILDNEGRPIPVDFVNTGNNHHLAIHVDSEGKLHEHIVSFFEATQRACAGLPVINRGYKADEGWQFLFTLKQNEYVVFPNPSTGFDPHSIDLTNPDNYTLISPNLFRVQKISTKDYFFRHHLETMLIDDASLKDATWKRINTPQGLIGLVKVRVDHIGRIVAVGE